MSGSEFRTGTPAPFPSSPETFRPHTETAPRENLTEEHDGKVRRLEEELERTRRRLCEMEERENHRAVVAEELQAGHGDLKRRLEELGRANSGLRQLMEATDAATLFVDRELLIRCNTPGAAAVLSLDSAGLSSGHPLREAVRQLDYPEIEADARRVLETRAPVIRKVQAGGRWYLARFQFGGCAEGDGNAGVLLTLTDITARHAMEEALQVSEGKYRTLFDSIDEGFCVIEVLFDEKGVAHDYRFIEANPAFEKHTGLKMETTLGRTMRELAPDHEPHWYEIYGHVALTGEPRRFDQPAEALGRYYDVYAFRMGKPEERQVAVLFNDITARKQAEKAVAADLRAMQTLREFGALVIPQTEIETLYGAINAAAMKLTGADAGTVQILDAATRELVLLAAHGFPSDSPQRFGRLDAASATSCGMALASGKRTVVDFDDPVLSDPKGDLRWHVDAGYLSAQSTPLLTRSGRPLGMMSTHWHTPHRRLTEQEGRHFDLLARQAADLIEQRLAFMEIQSARLEAETAGRAKDHFLAVLSHELRTPLTPVLMVLDDLLSETALPESMRGILSMAHRNVLLEVQLIDDLLDMTHITRGKMEFRHRPMDVHESVKKALEVCQRDLEAKNHRVELSPGAAVCEIAGDAMRLQQVFWNLIKNACKFTPPGGSIRITSHNPEPGVIEIDVADTGVGLKPEVLKHIFDPFMQADSQVARRFGGLGLGLAISRAITEAHGGTLSVRSAGIDQGAVFTVTLPVLPAGEQ
ncbi:MAG: domain S-box protein [Verrucomicrobiales bacterium]|nr:domain S-box protein [Verrucomicrobiales bacterium]